MNGVAQALLFFASCMLMLKKKKGLYLIPWAIGYLMLMPIALAKSLQYSSCFYVSMLGSLILLLLSGEQLKKAGGFVFLNIGIALAYFDFLTYPAAAFGIPMAVFLMLDCGSPVREKLIHSIRSGLMWCLGYGGMWSSKWVLAGRVLGRDIVADGLSQFSLRTSDIVHEHSASKIEVITVNYKEFLKTPVVYLMVICILCLVYAVWKNRRNISCSVLKARTGCRAWTALFF